MSNNLMDTEVGGEQTQYEGTHTYVEPHDKQAGQLGDPSSGTKLADHVHKAASNSPNTQGVTPTEKIRYGQSIQEGGAGGKTEGMAGRANTTGGFGGEKAIDEAGEDAAHERRAQGYGGKEDMDRTIGA